MAFECSKVAHAGGSAASGRRATECFSAMYSPDANSAMAVPLAGNSSHQYVITDLDNFEAENALQLRVLRREIAASQARASHDGLTADLQGAILQLSHCHKKPPSAHYIWPSRRPLGWARAAPMSCT